MTQDIQSKSQLREKQCITCSVSSPPLSKTESESLLNQIDPEWAINMDSTAITRSFQFRDFYQTMAFANAVAWIANQQDHHPELVISYRVCQVSYSTHSIKGLSENDFICAAKIDHLQDRIN